MQRDIQHAGRASRLNGTLHPLAVSGRTVPADPRSHSTPHTHCRGRRSFSQVSPPLHRTARVSSAPHAMAQLPSETTLRGSRTGLTNSGTASSMSAMLHALLRNLSMCGTPHLSLPRVLPLPSHAALHPPALSLHTRCTTHRCDLHSPLHLTTPRALQETHTLIAKQTAPSCRVPPPPPVFYSGLFVDFMPRFLILSGRAFQQTLTWRPVLSLSCA